MPRISLEITDDALAELEHYARQSRLTPGAIIRDAIARDLLRRHRKARKVYPDERSLAPLRSLLADDFAYAKNWSDLQSRLSGKGYTLAASGGGLILISAQTGGKIAKASELGYAHGQLVRRFGTPFPDPPKRP